MIWSYSYQLPKSTISQVFQFTSPLFYIIIYLLSKIKMH